MNRSINRHDRALVRANQRSSQRHHVTLEFGAARSMSNQDESLRTTGLWRPKRERYWSAGAYDGADPFADSVFSLI